MSTVNTRIESLSPEKIALLAERLRAKGGGRRHPAGIPRRSDPSQYVLSFAQQRLWFLQRLDPKSAFYSIPAAVRFRGTLDLPALERALEMVLARHEVLRSRFETRSGAPALAIRPPEPFRIPCVDLSPLGVEEREAEIFARARHEVARPFSLEDDLLVRATLFREGNDRHTFLLVVHHIVADGWSMGILVRELISLYQALGSGTPALLPDLPLQYADYAAWQLTWLETGPAAERLADWKRRLAGMPQVLELPLDSSRPPVQTFRGRQVRFRIPGHLVEGIRSLSHQEAATVFMGFLAAYGVFLGRISGQAEFGVGIPVAQRNNAQIEGLVGFFVNTLVLRTSLQGEPSFREMLRRVRETALAAYDNQDIPFEKIVDALDEKRDISHTPLFQAMFDLQRSPLTSMSIGGLTMEPLELEIQTSKTDLLLMLQEEGDAVSGYFEYNCDLFSAASAEGWVEIFLTLLEEIVRRPDLRVSDLAILPERQSRFLLQEWNDTARGIPEEPLAALFEQQAARTPTSVALDYDGDRRTYEELNREANRLAWRLRELGVGPDTLVGLFAERSAEMVIAVLAIVKAGGAYLPMDIDYPRDRLSFMASDARLQVILTQERHRARLPETGASVVCIDEESGSAPDGASATPPCSASPENLAYVVYTSGSTGLPKGVSVTQRAVVRLVFNTNYISVQSTDRIAQASTVTFDAATFEIWGALLHGARLVGVSKDVALSPARMASLIRAGEINTLFVTTALYNHVAAEMPDAYHRLKTLLVGGEAADPGAFRAVLAGGPPGRLLNVYGPTECTTFATWYPVFSLEPSERSVPIGKPLSNTTAYVLDEMMRPVPVGVVGELYLGGEGLARDYLHRPDLTAEKFVPHPFSPSAGERLYRTGDRVRILPGGDIEFIGRRDFQAKIHGFRIEPGEVESVIAQHPDVCQVSVVVREDIPGEKRLVAYLVAREGRILEIDQLQVFLREKLPQYMVPSAFMTLAEIPLNANGKVNRPLLPPPDDLQMRSGAASTPPSTPLEKYLADHWKKVLGVETIGVHENFFYLGGDSMKGAVLINRLQKDLGESAPVSAIFLAPTIAQLAMYMSVYFSEAVKKRLGVESTSVAQYREKVVSGWNEERVTADTFVKFREMIPPLQPREGTDERPGKNRRAVFVLSPPRTGSTLFRVMLAGHPRLFAPPELELLSFNTLQERRAVLSDTYALWLEATVRALMEVEQCDAQRAQAIMEQCEKDNLTIKEFYRFLQDRLGDRLLVDKTPSYPLDPAILQRAEDDFEEPLYIHLTRHPYAMVYSFIEAKLDQNFFRHKHPFTRRQLGELIWTQSNRNILDFLGDIPPHRQYRLKFEEVLREPVAEMKRVAEFLGIEYDPRLIEPYKGERMTDGVTSRSQMVGDFKFYLRKNIDKRSVDRWKIFHAEEFLSDESWAVAELLGYDRAAGGASPHGSAAARNHTELAAIPRVQREGPLSLSSAQLRLWFLEQLEPGTALYNIPAAVRLRGKLDIDALHNALNEIVRRHEALRTIFRAVDGQPAQVILERAAIDLPVTEVQPGPGEDEELALQRLVKEAARIPFDLSREVLFRARLLRVRSEDHVLALSMHHIASDGWSVGILIRELAELYLSYSGGAASRLLDLPVQFADYAAWQRGRLEKGELAGQLDYWKRRLAGAATVLELPTDRPRPSVQTLNGARESFLIKPEDLRRIHGSGEAEGATPFMTLFSVFAALLHRYTGQEDICVGTPVANRTRAEIEPLIGFFVNTLVLRADLSGNPTFRTLLGRVRDMCEGAFDNQEAPFEKVVDAVQPGRDLSRSALFQVMFSYVRSGMSDAVIPGLTLRGMEVESGTSKFELTLEMTETQRGLTCVFEYNSDLFDRSTIRRMILHFQTLLQATLAHADWRIGDYPVIPEEEQRFLLRELNGQEAAFPSAQTFHELFEVQAAKSPDAPAVDYLGRVLTYGELNRRANQLARSLRRSGVGPECLCGLCMERSVEMIVGILGVLKAGGAYVALDPTYPQDRLQMIAADAGLRVVLTLASSAAAVPAGPWAVLALDADWPVIGSEDDGNLAGVSAPENLAYLIYTSGSTGRPKGVMISHRSAVNLWMGLERVVYANHAGRPLRTSLNAPLIFDASVQELVTLLSGHCLCIIPQEIRGDGPGLVAFLHAHRVDVVDCVPSQLKLMLTAGLLADGAPWVPEILLPGGEAIDDATWSAVVSCSATDAYNMYGPTECTVDSTICRFRGLPAQPSIGRPIVNVQHYVLDARLRPAPIGVAGELFIGGEGLARGYFGRPELTSERFLPNPFAARAGERMYRTGDRVKVLPDGHLLYLERLDHQVKVRGFRIELGEIEVALEKHPNIRQAAVVAQEESEGEKRLVAYYIAVQGDDVPAGDLRKHLKTTLPEHMIPVFFVAMKSLPLTPSGKLDRRALPKPDPVKLLSGLEVIAPRTPAEETLAEIWKQVLRVPEVGVRDNFFELGGDSILSIQVIARANEAGLRLTPRQLFQNPTIEALGLAAGSDKPVIADQQPVTGPVPLTPIQRQFFEEIRDDPHHWNQAVLLGIDGSLEGTVMREVVRHALLHHDALRMRFRRDLDAWVQWNDPPGGDSPYGEVDLTREPEPERQLREHAALVQRSLNLEEGPLVRVVRYILAGGDRLLIVIHHLVVDGVSWRILLEDLRRLYWLLRQHLPVELPPKTTSYKEWATRLEVFARKDALREELEYWKAELAARPEPLPIDFVGGENREDSCAWVEAEFSEEETAGLAGEEGRALNASIPELLLTGLLRAYGRWAGKRLLRVDMEGHGREMFQEGLDATRTVGWFTTLYPLTFDIRGAIGPREELAAVRDQVRRLPGKGFGYGLLRYMSDDESVRATLRTLGRAELSFNYLGRFERAGGSDDFRVIGEVVGGERSGRSRRSYLLDLSAKVMSGKLQLALAYSRNYHRPETAETLLQTWREEIRHVVRQCAGFPKGDGASEGLAEAGLSRTEVQGIIQELDVSLDNE